MAGLSIGHGGGTLHQTSHCEYCGLIGRLVHLLCDDMGDTMMIDKNTVLVILGRPATKKNSGQIVRVGRFHKLLPSKAFIVYEEKALEQLKDYDTLHFTGSLQLTVRYYLPDRRWWPDLIGLLQGTSDILQKAGIYDDDKYIVSYDGSCIAGLDKENPRCEIEIKELGPWLY